MTHSSHALVGSSLIRIARAAAHASPTLRHAGITMLVGAGIAMLFAQTRTNAAAVIDPLHYSRGYLVTGNYAVGSVNLTEQVNPPDPDGFSTGTININACPAAGPQFNCVPADAEIVAAYLYWETITPTADLAQASGVKFRNEEILLNDVMAVRKNSEPLIGNTATCWSSGTPLSITHFRADVLRFLPIRRDSLGNATATRLVTNADLEAHGKPLHQVRLPARNGNQIPESAGASLVLVYRDPSQPLRKIVFYDGVHVQSSLDNAMTQTLRGFYKSSLNKSASITHIIASGQPNANERVFFNDGVSTQLSAPNPVAGGSASSRAWSELTYDVTAAMNPPAENDVMSGYGDTATTTVDHTPGGGYDCLTWGAIIFSTAVADVDRDGLPDGLEDAPSGLNDPPLRNAPTVPRPLPNLSAMGASSARPDLFLEFNAMRTLVAKTHGSASFPYPGAAPAVSKNVPAHTHMPTPEVLRMLGDLYTSRGITPHFDVGDWTGYKALGVIPHADWIDDYTSSVADHYLVPSYLARGGEVIDETACNPEKPTCHFPAYPGTVSWKLGLQLYRDAPVGDGGEEISLDENDPNYFNWNLDTGRRRFDPARKGLFHYVLYAHARGKPKSEFPCLVNGLPAPYPDGSTTCTVINPEHHVPSSASGVADLPGGNVMVTLGFWDEFVGRPYVRASTTFHEIGHNLNLWHGGLPAEWGNAALNTANKIEPNCKPTYQSVMSYLFQAHGLFDGNDNVHLDLSGIAHDTVDETQTPSDQPLAPASLYRPAWYAPANSTLATNLGVAAASRFCDGAKFDPNAPPAAMARVYAASATASIDWNGDLQANGAAPAQDVNFDQVSGQLKGFDDWGNLRLDQIGAGRNSVKFQDGDLADFGSGDLADFGSGDLADFGSGDHLFGSGDLADFGSGAFFNLDSGDFADFGSGDLADFGSGDLADFGSGDLADFGSGSERQELDLDTAKGLGRSAPYALKACIITATGLDCSTAPAFDPLHHRIEVGWRPPLFGHVLLYQVSRKTGDANANNPYGPAGPPSTSSTTKWLEREELPDSVAFTYRARAEFDDQTPHAFSGFSQTETQRAVNDPPTAVVDSYQTRRNIVLNVAKPGVLANDTDVDSPDTSKRAVLVSQPPNGAVTLNTDGSFTYRPRSGFVGVDSFSYRANNGTWRETNIPMNSVDSNVVTVTITVTPR